MYAEVCVQRSVRVIVCIDMCVYKSVHVRCVGIEKCVWVCCVYREVWESCANSMQDGAQDTHFGFPHQAL